MKTKIKALLYTTKQKPRLVYRQWTSTLDQIGIDNSFEGFLCGSEKSVGINELGECEQLNGKIVAECDYEVEEIETLCLATYFYRTKSLSASELEKRSCLSEYELQEYFREQNFIGGYAIHINNLHIFDKPRELSEYITKQCQFAKCSTCKYGKNDIHCATIDTPITKAPQNMMYAYDSEGNKYVLISIQPQWLCKILNGEKTIEVRRVVLKEMIK